MAVARELEPKKNIWIRETETKGREKRMLSAGKWKVRRLPLLWLQSVNIYFILRLNFCMFYILVLELCIFVAVVFDD